jgi:hypothetical protein
MVEEGSYSIFKGQKEFTLRQWYLRTPHGGSKPILMSKYVCRLGEDLVLAIEKAELKGVVDLPNIWGFKTERFDELASWSEPIVIADISEVL